MPLKYYAPQNIPEESDDFVYTEKGFKNRKEYLNDLAERYTPFYVYGLANLLGPSEDFDGLVSALVENGGNYYCYEI